MLKKKMAPDVYRASGIEVMRSHADSIRTLQARGIDITVVIEDPAFAETLWDIVKSAPTADEALRPSMYTLAQDLRSSSMHPLGQIIEFQRVLTTLQLLAGSKFSESESAEVADDLVRMAPQLLDIDIDT